MTLSYKLETNISIEIDALIQLTNVTKNESKTYLKNGKLVGLNDSLEKHMKKITLIKIFCLQMGY